MRSALTLALICLLFSASATAFQDDCAGATLGSGDTLPINPGGVLGSSADFTMPTGCELGVGAFSDIVACFTPQNGCDVSFTCATGGGSNLRASIVELTSSSMCATDLSGDTCTAGGTDVAPPTDSVAAATLTGGADYCFVCQNTIGNATLTPVITATSGDCGALPVDLEAFSISD